VTEATSFSWPGDAEVAVSLTFDVDADSGFLGDSPTYARRLSSLSEARFGVVRGLPRIVALLQRRGLDASFFVPGHTAGTYPETVPMILEGGHEVGHHGHIHLRTDKVSTAEQREELELGLEALEAAGAPRPSGYRSPAWELTPETMRMLIEAGFKYDSSCMGDDRPYVEYHEDMSLLELPVHWSLDDWPRFGWSIDLGGNVASTHELYESWLGEYRAARAEGRHVTFTMHPEVIGRAYRFAVLERLVDTMIEDGNVWFARLDAVAEHVRPILS
jgi:peptidoglycan/xylan/chitin deacetylase (PgdA/CDA1 family)